MKTKTIYTCDHCQSQFNTAAECQDHEPPCLIIQDQRKQELKKEARCERLSNALLGERLNAPFGMRIGGNLFLVTSKLTRQLIATMSGASEIVATSPTPTPYDAKLIAEANRILSE